MRWFTADTHFGHKNIIRFCKRPFSNINEMNEVLIERWNKKVLSDDTVYVVGDFAWDNPKKYLDRLKGNIILIAGGHDYRNWRSFQYFRKVERTENIYIDGVPVILSHYCFRVWDKMHYNSWHLFGHSHGKLEPIGKSWDVGVDNNNYDLLSEEDIVRIMKERPDNPNLIGDRFKRR